MSNSAKVLALAVQANVPVILWGPPGVGKTATITALGRALNWPVTTIIAALYDPTDFSGLPIPDGNGNVYRAMPGWARQLAASGPALLFFDELSTAPPAVQAALLRIILDRVVAEMPLAPAVRIVAAANPPDQAADGSELALPLANRFVHLDWPAPTAAELADALITGFREPVIPRLPDDWQARIPAISGEVAAFLRARPQLVHAVPVDPAQQSRAWPSPRTWREFVIPLIAAARAAGCGADVEADAVAAAVGNAAAVEWAAWRSDATLPDPEELLAHPDGWVSPQRGDVALAVASAVAAAVAGNLTPPRWLAAWRVLARIADTGQPEAGAAAARLLVTAAQRAGFVAADGSPLPLPQRELSAFAPLLRAAGLLK